jgi:8-amino-7-oxononanoate synthase
MNHEQFLDELSAVQRAGLWRRLREMPHAGGKVEVAGRTLLNFSSNDYLNFSRDADLAMAAARAAESYGTGAGGSRLMSGSLPVHAELEAALARLTGQDAALLFPSGYQCNVALVTALAGKDDVIFSDALNHASLIDGMRLSRAEVRVFSHGDVEHLEKRLKEPGQFRRRFIITESVFSMDGDTAPLEPMRRLADTHDALLLVDEAHALGVLGHGGGLAREVDITPDVTIGTLSKSLGAAGGFVATSAILRDLLINKARPFIFSTALSPMLAAAGLEAVRKVERHTELGVQLLSRAQHFVDSLQQRGVEVAPSNTQIIPLYVGANETAVMLAESLRNAGIIATGIRPPTVPDGTARIRFSITLAHGKTELENAAAAIARIVEEISALPGG